MKFEMTTQSMTSIKETFKKQLIAYRYSDQTFQLYMHIFDWLEKFAAGCGESDYSPWLGQLFITEYSLHPDHYPTYFDRARLLIQRLDGIVGNKKFTLRIQEDSSAVPPQFEECLNQYIEHLRQRSFSESSIKSHRRYTCRMLNWLGGKVPSYDSLTADAIYDFFININLLSINYTYSVARSFLDYLFRNNVTKTNLSVCVPSPTRPRALPSIYTGDEIQRLLSSIDRSEPIGKRDFAILMLASHLGLRSCDIVNLSLSDIDYSTKTINIIQVKTSVPQTLVLNPDVEEALLDYIRYGRPEALSNKVFLTTKAPYKPIVAASCCAVTVKRMALAGIAAQGRRHGAHALRASYATALVDKGTPYAVIQAALGQDDPESQKYYIRTDVRRLRNCALDVPKPTGAFAETIGDLEVTV